MSRAAGSPRNLVVQSPDSATEQWLTTGSLDAEVATQYVWGARTGHRDELILRDSVSATSESSGDLLDERLWCLMDYYDPASIVDIYGNVVERYRFSAFGLRSIMAPDFSPRTMSDYAWGFAFKGQFLELDTGYYNYGYRYYSPELGRWLSRDPIGEKGGINLYLMAKNNPIINIDYLGLLVGEFKYSYVSTVGDNWQYEYTFSKGGRFDIIAQDVTWNFNVETVGSYKLKYTEYFLLNKEGNLVARIDNHGTNARVFFDVFGKDTLCTKTPGVLKLTGSETFKVRTGVDIDITLFDDPILSYAVQKSSVMSQLTLKGGGAIDVPSPLPYKLTDIKEKSAGQPSLSITHNFAGTIESKVDGTCCFKYTSVPEEVSYS